jgi:hypothetical protein
LILRRCGGSLWLGQHLLILRRSGDRPKTQHARASSGVCL